MTKYSIVSIWRKFNIRERPNSNLDLKANLREEALGLAGCVRPGFHRRALLGCLSYGLPMQIVFTLGILWAVLVEEKHLFLQYTRERGGGVGRGERMGSLE